LPKKNLHLVLLALTTALLGWVAMVLVPAARHPLVVTDAQCRVIQVQGRALAAQCPVLGRVTLEEPASVLATLHPGVAVSIQRRHYRLAGWGGFTQWRWQVAPTPVP
jgi:hypothetical protein